MDSEDPRSATSELRRFRFPKPGSQSLDTSQSLQPSASDVSKNVADRRSVASLRLNSEHRVSQLPVRSDVSLHQPKDNHLTTPAVLQPTASMIPSVLLGQTKWTPSSPETANKSSTRQSNSTIGYSTGWSILEPEDFENELKAHRNVASREHAFSQTTPALVRCGSSLDESPSRVKAFKRASTVALQAKQARYISSVSSGSAATGSIISSRSHIQRGSQGNGEVDATNHSHPLKDLFPFAKARLDNITYTPPKSVSGEKPSPENLRRQILEAVFGWEQDIEELVRDELSRHHSESMNAILLSKWLGATDADMVSMFASNTMSSSNWMSFALIQMSGRTMTEEVGRALAGKMLKKGDIHVAASILIGIGEHAHAIEMYTSHLNYMEAILLACLKFPTDSHRQSTLVRRWGEHIMIPSRQLLAVRCLSCNNMDSSESWASLNTELAEWLINYMRKVGLDCSALSQPPQPISSLGPTKTASLPRQIQSQQMPKTRETSQDSEPKPITSSAKQNITPGAITTYGRRSGTQLAKPSPDATVETDASPSSERPSASAKHDQYADQTTTLDTDETAQRRLSSIGETSESPNSTLPASNPAPVKPAPHDTKRQTMATHSGTLPVGGRPGDCSSQQSIPFLTKPRKGTPHPDFQPPFRTRDDIFEAFVKGSQPHNSFKEANSQNLTADTQRSSDSETTEKNAKASVPKPNLEGLQQLSDSNLITAFRKESQSGPPPTGRSFASTSTPRSPLCANETTRKVDQFIDDLHLPSSFSPRSRGHRHKEPAARCNAREGSVGRGRSSRRARAPYRFPSAPASLSEEELSCFGHPNPTSKHPTPVDPRIPSKRPCNRKSRAKHERSNARAVSEPSHRRPPLPTQKPERPLTGREKAGKAHLQSLADHRRRYHDRDISRPRRNSVLTDEKDHQRHIGCRTRTNGRNATLDIAGLGLGITAPDRSCPEKSNKESVLTGPTSRPLSPPERPTSNATTSTPFLQQGHFLDSGLEKLSGFEASSTLTASSSKTTLSLPTSSDSALSYQDSVIHFAETRSVRRTAQKLDCSDSTREIDVVNAVDEPIPQPSSCPSPNEPIPRRFDLGVHPAFHRNIRPSSFKPGPYPPTRRDPSRGRKPSLGEAWKPLDAIEHQSVAPECIVADVPVRGLSACRTNKLASGHHSYHRSFNEGITHKFNAMVDRVRSTSRGANAKSKPPPKENVVPPTTEAPTSKPKATTERVRRTSRGRKDIPTNSVVPYLPIQRTPYESLPAIWQREASSTVSIPLF